MRSTPSDRPVPSLQGEPGPLPFRGPRLALLEREPAPRGPLPVAPFGIDDEVLVSGLGQLLDHLAVGSSARSAQSSCATLGITYRGEQASVRIEVVPDGLVEYTTVTDRPTRERHRHCSVNDAVVFGILGVMDEIRGGRA